MQKLSLAGKAGVARGVLTSQYWRLKIGGRILGLKLKYFWTNWPFGSRKYLQNPNQISYEKFFSKITKKRWWNRKIGSVWVRLTEPPWFGGSAELTEPSEFGGSVNRTEQFGRSLQCFSIFQMRLSSFNKFLFLNVIKKNVWFFNRFSAYSLLAIYNKDFKKYRTQIHCPKIIFAPKVKFWQILECNNSKENVFVRYTWCSNKFWMETLKKSQMNESTI